MNSIRSQIRPYRPADRPHDKAVANMVKRYRYLFEEKPESAPLWLRGLESSLERARQFDLELDEMLASLKIHQPLPAPRPLQLPGSHLANCLRETRAPVWRPPVAIGSKSWDQAGRSVWRDKPGKRSQTGRKRKAA